MRTTRTLMLTAMIALAAMSLPLVAQGTPLTDMLRTEQRFAARALVAGWKQAFLEYFADDAVAFDGERTEPAKEQFRKQPDPPRDRRLLWGTRLRGMARSGGTGDLNRPPRPLGPGHKKRTAAPSLF